jgi:hypothetical protein
MSRQVLYVILMLAYVIVAGSGCNSHATPTSPSVPLIPAVVTVPDAVQATYTLFGTVAEASATGLKPVEKVEVYCDSCGSPDGHTFAFTDAEGFYTFSWAANGVHPLLVRKAGYAVIDSVMTFPDGTGMRKATVNGDTRFDIEIIRR